MLGIIIKEIQILNYKNEKQIVLAVLGFELRTLYLVGRCSNSPVLC
jgi:hypothetical protein